jgi:ATP-binding cassette subfamily B protein
MKTRRRFRKGFSWGVPPSSRPAIEEADDRRNRNLTDPELLKRLAAEAKPYRWQIAGVFLIEALATPIALLMPIPLAVAVDSVLESRPVPGFLDLILPEFASRSDTGLLVFVALLQLAVVLISQLQVMASYVLATHSGQSMTVGFRTRLFAHAQKLSFAFHDSKGTVDSIYRIQYDTPSLQNVTIDGFIPFVSSGITIVAMIYVTAVLSWQLALVALVVCPLLFKLSRLYNARVRSRYAHLKNLESGAMGVVQEVLTSLRVVKAFGREDSERIRFAKHSADGVRVRTRLSFAEGFFGLLVNLITAAGAASVLYLGVRFVQSGTLTKGQLLVVIAYLSQLYSPLQTISSKVAALQSSFASAQRAFELLDEAPEVVNRPGARSLDRASGTIEFRNVSFSYDEVHEVLHDLSFVITSGTRLGIAGRTGAGKTTLVSLLPRFYDPTEGEILLDGVNLREYSVADLRDQFAIVLQEPILFSSTIAENIAYAMVGASLDQIIEAAHAANAHDFITALPDGYNTLVGERGMRLSGGERQRISLARAFLKDAPILILDEPTSSVDIKTESSIMEAMDRLMLGRTTFMIAHRLGTLDYCESVIELEEGRIVGSRETAPPELSTESDLRVLPAEG